MNVRPLLLMASIAIALSPNANGEEHAALKHRHFVLKQTYHLKAPEGSVGQANLWIPIPENTQYQSLTDIQYTGDFNQAYITTDSHYGARTLFVSWDDSKQSMNLDVELDIDTSDWEPLKSHIFAAYKVPEVITYPDDVQRYLLGTAHVPVDGIVKEMADNIVGDEQNPLNKARKIYQWVADNMQRDNAVVGCGQGDVGTILQTGKLSGKCTDINSVFVALARAAGLPAREMFGLRLGEAIKMGQYSTAFGSADENGVAKETGGQHCRAMFYLAGFGWVPVDPADVTKMRLKEHLTNSDTDVVAVSDYLFGSWEMNWVGFNWARDFVLSPEPEQGALNNFGYPYAEVDGDPIDFYDPSAFSYEYTSIEQL